MSQRNRHFRVSRDIKLDPMTRQLLELKFERDLFESVSRRDPGNIEVLVQLGDLYTRLGEHEKGLDVDNRLTNLCPEEPNFFYSLACSYSILGRCEESADALTSAISLGYRDVENLKRDEDLENVRNTALFRELVARLESQ